MSHFAVGDLNEYSDHAPIRFYLNVNSIVQPDHERCYMHERLSWGSVHKEAFRSGIIANLPNFNHTLAYNCNNTYYLVTSFSNIITIADPLFKKMSRISNCFEDRYKHLDNKWFDNECKSARHNYHTTLRNYNMDKSATNHQLLIEERRNYKGFLRKKQRRRRRV